MSAGRTRQRGRGLNAGLRLNRPKGWVSNPSPLITAHFVPDDSLTTYKKHSKSHQSALNLGRSCFGNARACNTGMAKKKNSLVANINRKKSEGTSRPKEASTVSSKAYADMKQGWPEEKKSKK